MATESKQMAAGQPVTYAPPAYSYPVQVDQEKRPEARSPSAAQQAQPLVQQVPTQQGVTVQAWPHGQPGCFYQVPGGGVVQGPVQYVAVSLRQIHDSACMINCIALFLLTTCIYAMLSPCHDFHSGLTGYWSWLSISHSGGHSITKLRCTT